ncbi:MAG: (2Fe-2S)-binding protein [Bacillaceae bacterium]|nr:(2Fe-2S)-binding protein [Bacillaceae bacterium]
MPRVTVIGRDKTYVYECKEGEHLLTSAIREGVPLDFYCSTGKCRTCVVRVVEGMENLSPISDTEAYRLGSGGVTAGERLSCQAFVEGDVTIRIPE